MLNSRNIDLLRPDVAVNCRVLIERAAKRGCSVLVTQTVRDDEYQATLYAQGRTKPGKIITNSPVTTFHSVKAGLAFDICQNIKGREYNDEKFWQIVGAIGKEIGFTWGGDWKSIVDKPHFQWDDHGKYTGSMIRAGKYPPPMPLATTEKATKPSIPDKKPLLRRGSSGSTVKQLQTILNWLDHQCGVADGIFGPKTESGVRSFQKMAKIAVDGIVGPQTWAALEKEVEK